VREAEAGLSLPWWMPLSVLAWTFGILVYHVVAALFEVCDRRGWLGRFKRRDADRLSYRQMLPLVLFNQCCVLLPCMVACQALGLAFTGTPQLGIVRFCVSLAGVAVGHDIVMYAFHRGLLHNRRFRWLRHSLHHATGASRAISACYMSPPDFFLEIVCPFLVPLVIVGGGGADLSFHLMVAAVAPLGGLYEHSGYDFAGMLRGSVFARLPANLTSSHAHAEHHRRSTVSFSDGFGSPGLSDWLFATRWDLQR
jgi:sterol desaturase/sphingolipid hydroxylase (fatty acid hydroxylase superfamily)